MELLEFMNTFKLYQNDEQTTFKYILFQSREIYEYHFDKTHMNFQFLIFSGRIQAEYKTTTVILRSH